MFLYGMVKILGFSLEYAMNLDYYERAIYWGIMLAEPGGDSHG